MRKHRQYIVRSLKMYLRCFFGKFTEDIMLRKLNNYFTTFEKILSIGSLVLITGSAVMFGKDGILSVIYYRCYNRLVRSVSLGNYRSRSIGYE